jgi:hypothetical protein
VQNRKPVLQILVRYRVVTRHDIFRNVQTPTLLRNFAYNLIVNLILLCTTKQQQTTWPYSASELYRPSDSRLSAKLVPTFADRVRRVVSATDPHSRILGFLDRSLFFSIQVAPQLSSLNI